MHDEIYTIDKLPYEVPSLSFVIDSVLEDGTIIASVRGQAYQFKPEQSWKQTSSREYEVQPGCLLTTTLSITNYGIMNSSNVKFVDDPILP
jgi:hypothetical protein